jgi:hypothetical protein
MSKNIKILLKGCIIFIITIHIMNNDVKEELMRIQRSKLSFCDKLSLWWFFHSSPGFHITYESKNLYCRCLNCCPGCLELEFNNNICCKKDCICFLVCFTFSFV